MKRLFQFALFLLIVAPVYAGNTYFTAVTGNDSNIGSEASPFLTVQKLADTLECGDTGIVGPGSFDGRVEISAKVGSNTNLCLSWGSPIILKAATVGTTTLTASGNDTVIGVEGDNNGSGTGTNCAPDENICWLFKDVYWRIENFILDGSTFGTNYGAGMNLFHVSHVHMYNIEILNTYEGVNALGDNGIHCADLTCSTGPAHNIAAWDRPDRDIWFVGGRIHASRDHGMYLGVADSLVDGVEIDHNGGQGAQFTNSGSRTLNNNVMRNSVLHDNCCGVIMADDGNGDQIYNNVLWGHLQYCIGIGPSDVPGGVLVANNTCDGTITVGGRNSFYKGNIYTGVLNDIGTGNTVSGNYLATSADFVDMSGHDYTLKPTSGAINTAPNLIASFSTDKLGNARPGAGVWDAGALIYGGAPCVADHIGFYSQPIDALLGASLGTVSVELLTAGNVRCTTATNVITLSKPVSATWGTLASSSSLSVSATAGIATWTDLSVTTTTGSGSIVAAASGLSNVNSSSFTISSPGCTPHHLTFTSQPASALLGASLGTAAVKIYNASNAVCADATNTVIFSKHSGSCAGMTLGGTQTGAGTAGIFSSVDLNLTARTGSCSLDAAASGLTGATSNMIVISEIETLSAGFLVTAAETPAPTGAGGGAFNRFRIRRR